MFVLKQRSFLFSIKNSYKAYVPEKVVQLISTLFTSATSSPQVRPYKRNNSEVSYKLGDILETINKRHSSVCSPNINAYKQSQILTNQIQFTLNQFYLFACICLLFPLNNTSNNMFVNLHAHFLSDRMTNLLRAPKSPVN